VSFDVYRAYPGDPASEQSVTAAADRARRLAPGAAAGVEWVAGLLRHGARSPAEAAFVARFGQTTGPVMAKGVEDTAFYRWHRLVALNEVGGDPSYLGVPPEEFHAYAASLQADWPAAMTTLSTHDTKRSEDVRARLLALTELPQ